jgi:hypothetical protein
MPQHSVPYSHSQREVSPAEEHKRAVEYGMELLHVSSEKGEPLTLMVVELLRQVGEILLAKEGLAGAIVSDWWQVPTMVVKLGYLRQLAGCYSQQVRRE